MKNTHITRTISFTQVLIDISEQKSELYHDEAPTNEDFLMKETQALTGTHPSLPKIRTLHLTKHRQSYMHPYV